MCHNCCQKCKTFCFSGWLKKLNFNPILFFKGNLVWHADWNEREKKYLERNFFSSKTERKQNYFEMELRRKKNYAKKFPNFSFLKFLKGYIYQSFQKGLRYFFVSFSLTRPDPKLRIFKKFKISEWFLRLLWRCYTKNQLKLSPWLSQKQKEIN